MAYCQLLFLRFLLFAIILSLSAFLTSFSDTEVSASSSFRDNSYNLHSLNDYWIDSQENSECEKKALSFVYSHCFQLAPSFSFTSFLQKSFYSIKFFQKFIYHNLPPPIL